MKNNISDNVAMHVEKSLMPMDLLRAFFRHKEIVLITAGVFFLVVHLLIFSLLSPSWKVKSTIMLESNFVTQPLIDAPPPSDFEKTVNFHTEKDLLQSKTLLARVVHELNLKETRVIGNIEKIRIGISGIKRGIGKLLGIKKWDVPYSYEAAAVKALLGNLKVEAQPDSKLIHISYKAKYGPEAEATLKKVLDIYINEHHQKVVQRAEGVLQYLNAQVVSVREELEASENRLLALKNSKAITEGIDIGMHDLTDSTEIRDEIKLYLLRLEETQRNIKLLRDKRQRDKSLKDIRKKIEHYSAILNDLPEAELKELRVRREIQSQQEFLNLISRNIAKAKAVANSKAEDINLVQIVDAPLAKPKPDFPKGFVMLVLNLFMSGSIGLFVGLFLYMNDEAIYNSREIKQLTGLTTLAKLSG